MPGYSVQTLEACEASLSGWCDTQQSGAQTDLSGAARCAVETALLDLTGHQRGLPAHALLGSAIAHSVPLSALLLSETVDGVLAEAERAVGRGVFTLKLKVGSPGLFNAELRRLHALRDRFGNRIALRLDANGAFSLKDAPTRLAALAELKPEFIEEPVARQDLLALGPSPIPIALDESLQGGWEEALVESVAVAVLKPMILGGPQTCVALAARLIDAGLRLTVSHTWDGPIGLAAAAATALAIGARWPSRLLACGLERHPGLAAWPSVDLPFLEAGELVPSARPGLGLSAFELGA